MSFDPLWLALRGPADIAARDRALLARATRILGNGLAVDLGCGTGATTRAFAPGPRWRLVDHDPRLLAHAAERCPGAETVAADLAAVADLPFHGARLVTASALLDLVSADWTDALAATLAARRLPLYAALSYDGDVAWEPPLVDDADVVAAFNRDQRRDKGLLGPALGPAAVDAMAGALESRGYRVALAPSPWQLGPGEASLHAALVAGIADAASAPDGWRQARLAASVASRARVGHVDLLAVPSAQSNTTSESSP